MTEKSQEPTAALDAEQVAAYLSQHPEFFVEHDELIPELRIPHQPGDAVSLVERQVRCCASATSRCATGSRN